MTACPITGLADAHCPHCGALLLSLARSDGLALAAVRAERRGVAARYRSWCCLCDRPIRVGQRVVNLDRRLGAWAHDSHGEAHREADLVRPYVLRWMPSAWFREPS
jgi:hypothetical protein